MIGSAILGAIVSLACWLPPIIHFISGPLGPFIGGYLAGSRIGATSRQALGIGVIMGIFLVFPTLGIVTMLNRWINIDVNLVYLISFGIAVYISLLGAGGALIGGSTSDKDEK